MQQGPTRLRAAQLHGPSCTRDVVLKIECVGGSEGKLIIAGPRVAFACALALLLWELTAKLNDDTNYLLRNNILSQVTVPIAALCLVAVAAVGARLVRRLVWAWHRGLRWRHKQITSVAFASLMLFLQLANLCFWLTNVIYIWVKDCAWFSSTVNALAATQWTIFNTLVLLSIVQASHLVPDGAWANLANSLGVGWLGRLGPRSAGKPGAAADGPDSDLSRDSAGGPPTGSLACKCSASGASGELCAAGSKASTASSLGDHHSDCSGSRRVCGGTASSSGCSQGSCEKCSAPRAEALVDATTAFLAATVSRAELLVQGAVHFSAFLLVWVPTQYLIVTVALNTPRDASSSSLCMKDAEHPDCLIAGQPQCDDLTNSACWPRCQDWNWQCTPTSFVEGVTWGVGAMFNVSAIAFLLIIRFALHTLGQRPYHDYRVQNLAARIAVRTRVPTFIMQILSIVLVWYIRLGTCSSVLVIWVGLGPLQIVLAAMVAAEGYLFTPSRSDKQTLTLHEALQSFAWTEKELPDLVDERGYPEEPCFCFETALKAAYTSLHVYYHFEADGGGVTSIDNAMVLFGCRHYEFLREPTNDSNCLLMWGPDALVITFRGTASMANVKADLKAFRTSHPPLRGSYWLGERPLVHQGFLESWTCGGFNDKVLGRIRVILDGVHHSAMADSGFTIDGCCGHDKQAGGDESAGRAPHSPSSPDDSVACLKGRTLPFRILLAGHSLGGAMTHLCGLDLARALPGWGFSVAPEALPLAPAASQEVAHASEGPSSSCAPTDDPPSAGAGSSGVVSLSCYTYGAPRTGNHAFVREYNAHVPCWSVINGQDAVANQGKFLVLYKRPGLPVLLSRRGDLLVRPSAIEHSAHRVAGASIKQHLLLGSYCPSLAAVMLAQLHHKPMPGGRRALGTLGGQPGMAQLLESLLGMSVASMAAAAAGKEVDLECGIFEGGGKSGEDAARMPSGVVG